MWLLTIFPTFFIHAMLLAGVVLLACSAFLGAIAFFRTYKFPMQILGFILLGSGLYYEGALAHKESQAIAVAKLEVKLKEAEVQAAQTNVKIVEKVVKDTQVITEKGDTVIKYIQLKAPTIDNKCVITPDVIAAHNLAADIDSKVEPKKP